MFFLIVLLDYLCTVYGFSKGYKEGNVILKPFSGNLVVFTFAVLIWYLFFKTLIHYFPNLYPVLFVMHLIAINLWLIRLFPENYFWIYLLINPILIWLGIVIF